MAYEVNYTDTNKGVIFVEDNVINKETSLSIPGRSSTGYGQAIAENFLHLLENFANTTPPARPVEGQLWYDNSQGVDQLKVYDGTSWIAAGGLKKSSSEPSITGSTSGDLWVDTENQQLYLFTGSSWILVGPEFSDGLLTGSESKNIIGVDNLEYTVLEIRIRDQVAAIFSANTFTPKTVIAGFANKSIKPGINLSSNINGETLKFWGLSEKAEFLQVTNDPVTGTADISANDFLRKDETAGNQVVNVPIEIRSNTGLKIGDTGQITISTVGETGVIQHNTSGANINFKLSSDGTRYDDILVIDSNKRVGINRSPDEEFDVIGNVQISSFSDDVNTGILKVESTIESDNIGNGSVVVKGGVGVALNLNVGGSTEISGNLTTNNIIPNANSARNIGTSEIRYNEVYANSFIGNIRGDVTGDITGSAGTANRLTSPTVFRIQGDVEEQSISFDGQTGGNLKTFNVRINNGFVSNQNVENNPEQTDEILINRRNIQTGESELYRTTKSNFLKQLPQVMPAGIIMPYGGQEAPDGWLLCDGSVVTISQYGILFDSIGYNFRDPGTLADNGENSFALPDMRGRMPMGLDNMAGNSANRVTSTNADVLGNSDGSETKDIGKRHLPEHTHDMRGLNDEGNKAGQYYGIKVASGTPIEPEAIQLAIDSGTVGTVQGLPNSGGLSDRGLAETTGFRNVTSEVNGEEVIVEQYGDPLNVMNPYLALNYIIYTGQ